MARIASREVIASFDAYLRRTATLPEPIIRARIKDLQAGRLRAPDSSSPAFRPAPVVPGPVATGATMREETARGHGAASADERAARMRERHPIVRAPIAFPEHAQHAAEVPADDARARLAAFTQYVAERVEAGEVPWVDVPDLHRMNSLHDDRGNVFLGQNVRRLALDRRSGKALMRLLLAAEAASDNLRVGVYTTKRGLYYQHQARLADGEAGQVESDRAIAALATLLGVRRRSLGFIEARKGLMFGRLVLRDGEQILDLSKLGPRGVAVPRFTDDIEIVGSDADFILVVEKQGIAVRLGQERWWEPARCIIVCAEGLPALSTREFVGTLVDTLGIPALLCVDGDLGGIQVALTFAHGAISTALETPWLACNNVWWAGLYPSEIERTCHADARIPLDDDEREAIRRLLAHPSHAYVNSRVREELAVLLDLGAKVELDALLHDRRLVDDYLPKKVFDSQLVKL